MNKKNIKKGAILSILFFLPVIFLLFLYPSTNNYNPLDIVHEDVLDFSNLSSAKTDINLKDHITVLGFLGEDPESKIVETSNLKELIYDKFQGFKKLCGPTDCQTSTANFRYNTMAANAPYTKTTKNPIDSSAYTLYVKQQCATSDCDPAKKPYPKPNNGNGRPCAAAISSVLL